jgi:hypothetical protein
MSKEKIKIIQNILKKENRYDIAILLENAYFEDYKIDNWNGGIGEVNIFVHPNNYLQLIGLDGDERNLLTKLLDGLPHEYDELHSLKFSINTDIAIEHINDAIYIFVDEAGDMDFSSNGSKYYMFNFLIKNRPFNLHEIIANYRYSLLERNLDPLGGRRLDIESFHACEDNKYIRDEMFNLISTFDKNSVKSYSYILEKPKVDPSKRDEKDKFYVDNLNFAIHKLLDELEIKKDFIIITDRLPVHQNKNRQVAALKKGIKEYIKTKNLNLRYDIFHHCSASSVNLQIVDYISWAIFRKYERDEDVFYKKIEKYLIKIDEMTKDRKVSHYEK